jgi:outer membrane phospholipase A
MNSTRWIANFGISFIAVIFISIHSATADTGDDPTGTQLWGSNLAISDTLPMSPISMPAYLDNIVTGPATTQAATQPMFSTSAMQRSVSEIIGHFSAYEPMYFIAGPTKPVIKFQFSFKYRLFNEDAPLAKAVPLLSGLHFAYTQLCLWELDQPDDTFFDTNYMPEFFYSNEDIKAIHIPGVSELGLQTGYGHDSDGESGPDHRSMNMLFFRPIFDFGDPERFHFYVAPKLFVYIFSLSSNPDIAKYRGYCDLRAVAGWRQGLELSFLGRLGSDYNRGCVQLDLTFPLRDLLYHNLDLYLDAQYFNGYTESLLTYNKRTQAFRIGLALTR